MIEGLHSVLQAFLGTIFTWLITLVGASMVFVLRKENRKILDVSLGFAGGVMTAASFWSLLSPCIDLAEKSGIYGATGTFSFVPAAVGFLLGGGFVHCADYFIHLYLRRTRKKPKDLPENDESSPADTDPSMQRKATADNLMKLVDTLDQNIEDSRRQCHCHKIVAMRDEIAELAEQLTLVKDDAVVNDSEKGVLQLEASEIQIVTGHKDEDDPSHGLSWSRIILLIIAITVHNFPEGLAVGVGFGAIGKTDEATFENARNLAFGIGIQNFPEGMAVALPLRRLGYAPWKCFLLGQLSGIVEPLAGLIGASVVIIVEPILPYCLSFAAGAMIFVVKDDIIPEAQSAGNGKLASWGAMIGFTIMMSLDVGLG